MIEEQMNEMAEAFLRWPLPDDVCADAVACKAGASHRTGTNLLTATQARAMFTHCLAVVRAHDSASPTALANSGPKERQEAFDALKEELDDALAELAALRAHDRDGERMKWLADYMVEIEYEPTPEETVCIWLLMNKELRRERYETSDLRAAIDAAMRGEK